MEIRRVQFADTRVGDKERVHWLLFESHEARRPLRVLSDYEVDDLLDQIEAQRRRETKGGCR